MNLEVMKIQLFNAGFQVTNMIEKYQVLWVRMPNVGINTFIGQVEQALDPLEPHRLSYCVRLNGSTRDLVIKLFAPPTK